ncbi:MAG: hypothetical protein J0I26_07350 [Alphaproteobacteria bacterium]|nr:hypothetical protein [Alphaproteobacteria bacterium]
MSNLDDWAVAIHLQRDQEGVPLLGSVVAHIRNAVIEGGFVTKGRITSGLKEAYRPLGIDESVLRALIKDALRLLVLAGDVDELTTGAGRGYAATPPRRIHWGGGRDALLGGISLTSSKVVRHVEGTEGAAESSVMTTLRDELGRPAWRDILVGLGGADLPDGNASTLTDFARTLTLIGSRYSLDEPENVAVLSGRSEFFGSAESLNGRWQRVGGDGFYPAIVRSGYTDQSILLSIRGREATLWQPPSRDVWNWCVVGYTLAAGEPVMRYDRAQAKLDFLTPPPIQAERAALLTGEKLSAWSWHLDEYAFQVIAALMGSPR